MCTAWAAGMVTQRGLRCHQRPDNSVNVWSTRTTTYHAKAAITSQETMLTRANERSGKPRCLHRPHRRRNVERETIRGRPNGNISVRHCCPRLSMQRLFGIRRRCLFHLARFYACSSSIQYEITWIKEQVRRVKVGPLEVELGRRAARDGAMAGAPHPACRGRRVVSGLSLTVRDK
jgi:hypothetical protein